MKYVICSSIFIFITAGLAHATDRVLGETITFQSYNGVPEACVRITPIPGGRYDEEDLEDEVALCSLDLYSESIALCPKIWSTSPAVVLYDIGEGKFKGDRAGFQSKICAGGKVAKHVSEGQISRIKFTMNQESTSATFSTSPILYYHLSRYFNFQTKVPVSVWRSMDKSVLLNEVAIGGRILTEGMPHLSMIHAAWKALVDTIETPESYAKPTAYGTSEDILTSDGTNAYGVMYDGGGTQYGPEINGIPVDDTAEARYAAFMQTPTTIALATEGPLKVAIETGLRLGGATFTPEGREEQAISAAQMVFWMRETSEVLLIDYILAQQDRPGNIDYQEYYYWIKDGDAKKMRVRNQRPGEGEIPLEAIMIQRSRINDNDAGARIEYDNHFMALEVLDKLRHFAPEQFNQLRLLNADFESKGPKYEWLRDSLGLDISQVEMIRKNTRRANEVLEKNCQLGLIRFDLDAKEFFLKGDVQGTQPPCVN